MLVVGSRLISVTCMYRHVLLLVILVILDQEGKLLHYHSLAVANTSPLTTVRNGGNAWCGLGTSINQRISHMHKILINMRIALTRPHVITQH